MTAVYIVLMSFDGGEITELLEVFDTMKKAEKYIKKKEKEKFYDAIYWTEKKEIK